MNDNTIIRASGVCKHFAGGQIKALDGVSADIAKGEVVVIIGPSGSGKSTFLRCLNLLEVPTDGVILFNGHDITDKHTNINIHRQKMGMVFQHFNLFPHKTILDNMTLAPIHLLKKGKKRPKPMLWLCWSGLVLLTVPMPTPVSSPAVKSSVLPSCGRWLWSRK